MVHFLKKTLPSNSFGVSEKMPIKILKLSANSQSPILRLFVALNKTEIALINQIHKFNLFRLIHGLDVSSVIHSVFLGCHVFMPRV